MKDDPAIPIPTAIKAIFRLEYFKNREKETFSLFSDFFKLSLRIKYTNRTNTKNVKVYEKKTALYPAK